MALQEIVYILGDACAVRPVLADTLPEGEQEIGGILMLKQQIDLVNENKGVAPFGSVLGNAV